MPAEAGSPQDQTTTAPSPSGRRPRAAQGKADPNHPPFTGFLERDALRQSREQGRRRTFIISVAVHVVVFAGLLVYSLFQVDELWSPTVEVKVFAPAKLPPGVQHPKPPTPAVPPQPATR